MSSYGISKPGFGIKRAFASGITFFLAAIPWLWNQPKHDEVAQLRDNVATYDHQHKVDESELPKNCSLILRK